MCVHLKVEDARHTRPSFYELLVVFSLIAIGSILWWGKMASFWGDSSRWLFEGYRVALGEVPYRDFSWQYPPLSILLLGACFRLFGSSIVVAQVFVNVLSIGIVLLTWVVARRLLPARSLHLPRMRYASQQIA